MPDVLVEVRGRWLGSARSGFLQAISAALAETLRVPAAGQVLRLVEHPPENIIVPAGRGERFTRVEVTMTAGHSGEARHALQGVAETVAYGCCEDRPVGRDAHRDPDLTEGGVDARGHS